MERQHPEHDQSMNSNETLQDSTWPLGARAETAAAGQVFVLVATADEAAAATISEQLTTSGHRVECTTSLDAARTRLESNDIDLLLVDIAIDQKVLELVADARADRSWRRVIVWGPAVDSDLAIRSIRSGACDVLQLPRHLDELTTRVHRAAVNAKTDRGREERIERLAEACERLRASKNEMSDQVDVLCGDLATAWSSIKDQMSIVETTTEFRTLISQELDVEQMLRTSLEYIMEKVGPTNGVVYLREAEGDYGVGAYVNYEWQDRNILPTLEQLGTAVCPQMLNDPGLLKFDDASDFAQCEGVDTALFADAEVVACSCPREDDCLAVLVLFRRDTTPFSDSMASILDALRTVLAEQLGRILRVHKRSTLEWPDETPDDADWGDLAA
jgi:DNA-binding response OmpR family regulator